MTDGRVVVTGAYGFVGRALCAHWAATGRPYRAIVRSVAGGTNAREHDRGVALAPTESVSDAVASSGIADVVATVDPDVGVPERFPGDVVAVGDLATVPDAKLDAALDGVSAVVHLAGRAHVLRDDALDPAALYNAANVDATRRLAAAAVRAGVERFILASSVKVLGEATLPGHPFTRASKPSPRDDYARSKLAAEEALLEICKGTRLTPVILRLPLVYGPGVRANFLRLFDAIARGTPLPIGSISNRRNLLFVGNLVHAIDALIDVSNDPMGTWLIADGQPVSTPALAKRIGVALGVLPRMLSVPVPLLEFAARMTGRGGEIARLAQSLEVDATPLCDLIGPMPHTLDQGLAATANWWSAEWAKGGQAPCSR